MVEVGPPAAPSGLDAPGGQVHHLVERLARQVGVRCGPAQQVEEAIHLPLARRGHLGHDLLGEDVERGDGRVEHVEVPGPHPGQQGGALDQFVTGLGVEASRRRALHVVVGPAHPLEERGDGPGGADLADQFHRADVDAQLEGGGGHQRPEVAGPEALLHQSAPGRREAPVVGGHLQGGVHPAARRRHLTLPGAEPEGQLVGHPLGHLPGVDEDQRGPVLEHVPGDPVEDVGELGAAGHRLELRRRELDVDVELPGVPAVDDGCRRSMRVDARQQAGHHVQGALGGRESDALQPSAPLIHQVGQPLEAEGEVGPPLVAGQGVDLVDDHRVDAAEHGPRRGRGHQQVEGLGGGDQDVRRVFAHGGALGGRGVARADRHREPGGRQAQTSGLGGDPLERTTQVLLHVDGQGPQR